LLSIPVVLWGFFHLNLVGNPDQEVALKNYIPNNEKEFPKKDDTKNSTENYWLASEISQENCDWHKLHRVVDGDTIAIDDNIKVRLLGIDTPETVHPRKPVEPFGPEATAFAKKFLKNEEKVCLQYDIKADKLDKYKRILAHIFRSDGRYLNMELTCAGLARTTHFPVFNKKEFRDCELSAQEKKIGIWSL